ncbi:MAG: DUF4129 domain-containing protein [Pyrinomonadaceae bacterium]
MKTWAQKSFKSVIAIGLIVLCVSFSAFGATLEEYAAQIAALKHDVKLFIEAPQSVDATELNEKAKRFLPVKEKVTFENSEIETNNSVLLDRFSALSTVGDDEKVSIAVEIQERLNSIEYSIEMLQKEVVPANNIKIKRDLNTILSREEYAKPNNERGFLMSLWDRFLEWLKSLFPESKPLPRSEIGFGFGRYATAAQWILYTLIFALIAYLLFKFLPVLRKRFFTSDGKGGERIILGETISSDATSVTLFSEAEALAAAGDLRGAVRKGYIALLFELGERSAIKIAWNKTNRDYLRDLRNNHKLLSPVRSLTNEYERHWYGDEPVAFADWDKFRGEYDEVISAAARG